jgi:metallo-beta-lactamase family protein
MTIQFCGAAREVTGSAHLLTLSDGYKILMDCGLYQGRDKDMEHFNQEWLFDPAEIDCLILSHAHIDHSGRIPKLVKDGFRGKIFATHATYHLCNIMLLDSAMIQEREAEQRNKRRGQHHGQAKPLYTMDDVPPAMERFVAVGYRQWTEVAEGVRLQFRDAGHILGSASVALEINENGKTTRLGFTGDIGRPHRPILRDPQPMQQLDYLISESTYGDTEHLSAPHESDKLLKIIKEVCIEKRGKLIIPAFSIGRTQEIVYMMDKMSNEGLLPEVPVYVDSPLAVNATEVFRDHPECYDSELLHYMAKDPNPFGFNNLRYVRDVEVSKSLNESKEACVIISASGMGNAGRVVHHLYHHVGDARNGVLIVGYCVPSTPGGMLREGAEYLHLFGEDVRVNASVYVMDSFSAHGDRQEMYDFMQHQRGQLKKLFLVHGTIERQEAFKEYLQERGFGQIEIPELGEKYRL